MVNVLRATCWVLMAGVLTLLAACSSGGGYRYSGDYRNIRPVWVVLNAPVPVPHPVMRPKVPRKAAVVRAAPSRTATTKATKPASLQTVRVAKGDTVYAISRRTGVHVRAIIAQNNLRPPYLLKPGDNLAVPRAPVHVVRKGETSYSISRSYGVDLSELMRLNGIRWPYTLYPGQKLKLPPSAIGRATVTRQASLPTPPPRAGNGFDWPVRGRVLSGYGPKKGGLHNDGINIAVARGTAVKAAESGVVAYAGNGLKGFGNLILMQHDGGWITAYAHNDRLLVKRGDRVRRGQTIAAAGSTGNVNSPQVHFEIRRGRKAVNPMTYLSK